MKSKDGRNRRLTLEILLGKSIKDAAKEAGISHGRMCKILYRETRELGIYPQDTTRFLKQARSTVSAITDFISEN